MEVADFLKHNWTDSKGTSAVLPAKSLGAITKQVLHGRVAFYPSLPDAHGLGSTSICGGFSGA